MSMLVDHDYDAGRSSSAPLASSTLAQPPSAPARMEEQAPLVTQVHRTSVRAVHRLYSSALTEEKNKLRYGLQAMAIHGHTYEFEVKFRGPAHRATGQIGGAGLLEDIMSLSIHEILHARNLDTDIPFFHSRPSTLENVCLTVWRNIGVIMAPHPYNVCEVSVECQPCPKPQGGQVITRSRVSFAGEMVAMPSP